MFIIASLVLTILYFMFLLHWCITNVTLKKHHHMNVGSTFWRFKAKIDIKYYLVLFYLLFLI